MCFKSTLEHLTNAKIHFDMPMRKHTSLGVGGSARYYAEIDSLYSLNQLICLANEHKVNYKVIGNGTNILVSDLGFDGLIIDIKRLNDIFFKQNDVRAMAGAKLDKLIKFMHSNGLTGLEELSGIPATVGGAIVMNAGAFKHNISDHLVSVETLSDGKIKFYNKKDCKFSYRTSRFLDGKEVVISAVFSLPSGDRESVSQKIKSYIDLRHKMHPVGRSCGSVFKNPKPFVAGELIDKLGLKGYSVGGASVSLVHANFITTQANAKAKDVRLLIEQIKQKDKQAFNVQLTEEVEYLGEF